MFAYYSMITYLIFSLINMYVFKNKFDFCFVKKLQYLFMYKSEILYQIFITKLGFRRIHMIVLQQQCMQVISMHAAWLHVCACMLSSCINVCMHCTCDVNVKKARLNSRLIKADLTAD